MGIFSKFQPKKKEVNHFYTDGPSILFGRYTDRNKTKEQYDSWDKSVGLFKEKRYLDAYMEFFNYLNDNEIENIDYKNLGNKIVFKLIQGSKIVNGTINDMEIQAEAEVVRFLGQNVPVMSRLLHENYDLYFSKFAIKNDLFTLKYFSPVEDSPPQSLYYALKEVATVADYYDDVLVDEFDSIEPINVEHIEQLTEEEKRIKVKYLRKWISEAISSNDLAGTDKFDGALSYRLLNLAFKIHYLLTPEGRLLDEIRQIQSIFYEETDRTTSEKNYLMLEEFNKINGQTDEIILKSFYKIKATFAIAQPTLHKTVANFMNEESAKTGWYVEHNHQNLVQQVCEYIVSYSCYMYGLPAMANDILHVFWRVHNPDFFKELGFRQVFFDSDTQRFNIQSIKNHIKQIINHSKKRYPRIKFNVDKLNFKSSLDFDQSFIKEFCNLNYD